MADKLGETLVDALKQALAGSEEHRLYRSGKLAGLFPGRAADAAAAALRDGLLEVVRTETRGKTTIEWVRVTPRGVSFLHEAESPVRVLRELKELLKANLEGVPGWVAEIRASLKTLEAGLVEDTRRWAGRLEALGQRVEEALRRANGSQPALSDGMTAVVPWGVDALTYLTQRQESGAAAPCTLPELFRAAGQRHHALTIKEFHDGLRRLHDRGSIQLLAHSQPAGALPEPEYALIDEATVYYYARR